MNQNNQAIKRMLINATHSEEIRVATVTGNRLDDIDIEQPNREQKKANIYLGIISRIEPSLEAVFVNYGANRHGFLPLKEIERSYFSKSTNDPKADFRKILKEGQELLVQVEKEERGNKGAALTTYISLAGCYLVLMANNPKAGGISRRIEGDERNDMREILSSLTIPDNMGVIIRTAGLGKKTADLQWDLDVLLQHWQAIKTAAGSMQAPCLLHQESNVIIRAIRDNLRPHIKEILIDDEELYQQAKQYIEILRSDSKNVVKYYKSDIPLFTRFQIESQIEEAYHHEIRLQSGGSLVFDRTEALTAIDINSAQSTKGQDIENTAFHTNLEAAEEIARQLRLRDVGGLIVIDFIDMESAKHQREVENRLRDALEDDRARVQTGRISRFGILEMSRQRLKTSLGENTQVICSKCSGKGSVRTVESLSLSLLRLIEEESLKQNTKEVHAQLPIELCTFLANEKRNNILEIEKRSNTRIVLIPNQHYIFPNYKINRIKAGTEQPVEKSYNISDMPDSEGNVSFDQSKKRSETAAVSQFDLPKYHTNKQPSILKRLWSSIFSNPDEELEAAQVNQQKPRVNHNNKASRSDKSDRNTRDNHNQRQQHGQHNQNNSNSAGNNRNRRNKRFEQDKDQRDKQQGSRPNRDNNQNRQANREVSSDFTRENNSQNRSANREISSDLQQDNRNNNRNNRSKNRSKQRQPQHNRDYINDNANNNHSNLVFTVEPSIDNGYAELGGEHNVHNQPPAHFYDDKNFMGQTHEQLKQQTYKTPVSQKSPFKQNEVSDDFFTVIDNNGTISAGHEREQMPHEFNDTLAPDAVIKNDQLFESFDSKQQEVVIKKATDRIKITPASNMSKRSFQPKKKLPFATAKYLDKPNYDVDNNKTLDSNISESNATINHNDYISPNSDEINDSKQI